MLTLTLIRHGQTEWSRRHVFCGRNDPPLNDTGRAMAEALAAGFADGRFDAVYASPLQRAVQTAEPVARRGRLAVRVDPDLLEISCGRWEGCTVAEAGARDPEAWAAWQRDPARHAPPGGETGDAALGRALAAVDRIRAAHADGRVVIVAHKGNIRLLVTAWLGMPAAHFRARLELPLTAVTVVEMREVPRLVRYADTSHLPPALRAEAEE